MRTLIFTTLLAAALIAPPLVRADSGQELYELDINTCLKSTLIQEIRRQAKPQLEKPGFPKDEGCDGLTEEQLKQIDFSQIDLGNFFKAVLRDMAEKTKRPSAGQDKDWLEGWLITAPGGEASGSKTDTAEGVDQ